MVPKLADFGLARGVPRSEKSRVKNMLLGGGVWKAKQKLVSVRGHCPKVFWRGTPHSSPHLDPSFPRNKHEIARLSHVLRYVGT